MPQHVHVVILATACSSTPVRHYCCQTTPHKLSIGCSLAGSLGRLILDQQPQLLLLPSHAVAIVPAAAAAAVAVEPATAQLPPAAVFPAGRADPAVAAVVDDVMEAENPGGQEVEMQAIPEAAGHGDDEDGDGEAASVSSDRASLPEVADVDDMISISSSDSEAAGQGDPDSDFVIDLVSSDSSSSGGSSDATTLPSTASEEFDLG